MLGKQLKSRRHQTRVKLSPRESPACFTADALARLAASIFNSERAGRWQAPGARAGIIKAVIYLLCICLGVKISSVKHRQRLLSSSLSTE